MIRCNALSAYHSLPSELRCKLLILPHCVTSRGTVIILTKRGGRWGLFQSPNLYRQAPKLVKRAGRIHEPLSVHGNEVGCTSCRQPQRRRVCRTNAQHLPAHRGTGGETACPACGGLLHVNVSHGTRVRALVQLRVVRPGCPLFQSIDDGCTLES